MGSMTSRERVLLTINHREPDRIPLGEWGIDHDHVEKILGKEVSLWRNRRLETLFLWENRRDELVRLMREDYEALVEALDYDIITLGLVPPRNAAPRTMPRETAPGSWEDGEGREYRYAASNDSIECVSHPPARESLTAEELNRLAEEMARPFEPSRFELIDYFGARYGNSKVLLFRDIDVFSGLMSPFGGDFSHELILPMTHPEEVKKLYPLALKRQRALIGELKKRNVSIGMEGKDFCMNSGPMFTPDSLRDVFFPFQKLITDGLREAGIHPFFHCCGNTWDILEDFVAAGWTGYQSVQKSAGMDWKRLKEEYGERLTIWAGVSCETLVEGELSDVDEEVGEALRILAPGGGFIFGSTNSVQYGARTENYLRALELARRFRY